VLGFRLLASLALGAEWGISHNLSGGAGGPRDALSFRGVASVRHLGRVAGRLGEKLPAAGVGLAVVVCGLDRAGRDPVTRAMEGAGPRKPETGHRTPERRTAPGADGAWRLAIGNAVPFAICFGIASLTIASGTINVFYAKDLPQSVAYTVFFWCNVVPGMLAGTWVVKRQGVGRALALYAAALVVLSVWA